MTIHFEIREIKENCAPLALRGTFDSLVNKEQFMGFLKEKFPLESFNHSYWKEEINKVNITKTGWNGFKYENKG